MNKYILDRHQYAKELTKLYILKGTKKINIPLKSSQIDSLMSVSSYKELLKVVRSQILNKPQRTVKHAVIYKHNSEERFKSQEGLLIGGIFTNYKELLKVAKDRHIQRNSGTFDLIVDYNKETDTFKYEKFDNKATCTYKIKMVTI
jgi:predicted HNH restriction endonuclease